MSTLSEKFIAWPNRHTPAARLDAYDALVSSLRGLLARADEYAIDFDQVVADAWAEHLADFDVCASRRVAGPSHCLSAGEGLPGEGARE